MSHDDLANSNAVCVAVADEETVVAEAPPTLAADSLVSGVSVLLALSVIQRLVGFVRNVLFCRVLTPEELGRWNLAFSLIVLLAPVAVLGIPGSFGRYLEHYRQRRQLRVFLRRTTIVSSGLAVVLVTALGLFYQQAAWLVYRDASCEELLLAVAVSLLAVILFNYLTELFTALRRVRLVSFYQFVNSSLFAAIGLAMLYYFELGAVGVVAAYALACLISSVAMLWPLLGTWRTIEHGSALVPQREMWFKLLPFAAWIWTSNLLSNLYTAADRYMIVHFSQAAPDSAAAMVGQYHSSRVIADLLVAVSYLLASVLLPYLSKDWEAGNRAQVSQHVTLTLKVLSIAFTAGTLIVLVLSPVLFGWILAGKYEQGLTVFPLTMTYCIWFGLNTVAQNYLWCAEKARKAVLSIAIGLVVNVGLNFWLLPIYGLIGAVSATTLANGFSLLFTCYLCRQEGMEIPRGFALAMIVPAIVVLGPSWGGLSMLGIGWLLVGTERIVSKQEKHLLAETAAHMGNRFGWRQRGSRP